MGKQKFNEPSERISVRVPRSKREQYMKELREYVEKREAGELKNGLDLQILETMIPAFVEFGLEIDATDEMIERITNLYKNSKIKKLQNEIEQIKGIETGE